jgi:hypothetical protein
MRSLLAIVVLGGIVLGAAAFGQRKPPSTGSSQFPKWKAHHETEDQQPDLSVQSPLNLGYWVSAGARVRLGKFVSIQVNVDSFGNNIRNDAANEPSICIDPTNPDRMAIGWRQFDSISSNFRQAGYGYTTDGGKSWRTGKLTPGTFRSDPVLASTAEGVFYYYSLKSNFLCDIFKSVDGGATWTGPVAAYGGDKNWMTVDQSASSGKGFIYGTWSNYYSCCGDNTFTRSTNGGTSFLNPIAIPTNPLFGTISVGPNGEMYVAGSQAYNSGLSIARSTNAKNGGQTPTFDLSKVLTQIPGDLVMQGTPNPGGLMGQVWVDVDRSDGPTRGYVYVLASIDPPGSDPLDVYFTRSTDGGQTWSAGKRINDDPTNKYAWQWFGTMSVAPNGRIDVIWNDTRNDSSPSNPTYSEMYYSFSEDGGVTWSKNIPVTIKWNHFLGYPQQNKIGDYYQSLSDNEGMNVAFAATFNGEQDIYYLRIGIQDAKDALKATARDYGSVPPPLP